MTDAHEAVRQYVLQKAADEFMALQPHHLVLVVVAIALVAEAHMLLIAVDEAMVVDGDLAENGVQFSHSCIHPVFVCFGMQQCEY